MIRAIRTLIMALLVFSLLNCKENAADLQSIADQINTIDVYDVEGMSKKGYSDKEISNAFRVSIDSEVFKALTSSAKYKDEWVMWMGSRFAIVHMHDGTQYRLALSYYGGFFKVLGYYGYFYFEDEVRKTWEQVFSREVVQENYIPKRIERNKRNERNQP